MQTIKIILADDHNIVREGLRALLQTDRGIEIVAEAEDGIQAVQLVKTFMPDLVLMDILMPHLNGLDATRQIIATVPTTRVLILSSYCSDDYVQQLMEAGAAGYLLKQTLGAELLKAIHEVDRGNAYFSPEVARRLRDQCRQRLASAKSAKGWTPRVTPQLSCAEMR